MANKGNWDNLPLMRFNETATRQFIYGENVMVAKHVIEPGFPPFAHSHPHEQILCIAGGHCIVTVGDEKFEMKAGDMVVVPPNVVHDLEVLGDETVLNFDIFSPVREDYIEMMNEYHKK